MRARSVLQATTAIGMTLLVGCTPPAAERPGPTPSAASTPTAAPSPTPTDRIQIHSDPATGIVFEDVPDLTGDAAAVYDAVAVHQNAFWETLRTNQMSPVFATTTSPEMQALMQQVASHNASQGLTIAGRFHTRIADVVVRGDDATATKCDDFGEATFTTDAGVFSAEDVKQDVPQRGTVELRRVDGDRWFITKVVGDGTC